MLFRRINTGNGHILKRRFDETNDIRFSCLHATFVEIDGPVIADICVDKKENCFPMIQSGSAHNEMILSKGQKQDAKSVEKGKILV